MEEENSVRYHVISGDEWIIDSDEFNVITLESDSGDQTADPSKA